MAEITVDKIRTLASLALQGQGLPTVAADEIAEEMAIAEYMGIKTHGIGKLVSLNLGDLTAEPDFIGEGPIFRVDGKGGNGFLVLRAVAEMLVERTKTFGIALATISNTTRYSSLFPYPAKVAKEKLIGILMNSAGPPAVAPFGSIDPVTGTNPICISFQTTDSVHSFDLATSEIVWGEIRQAALEGRRLPSGPFLNTAGDVTSDPTEVNAVKVFGGPKGSAINVAIEILSGILGGGKVGAQCETEFDCGAFFLSIDPNSLGISSTTFSENLERLFTEIRNSRPVSIDRKIRVAGDRGRSSVDIETILKEEVSVPQPILDMLGRMASGEDVSELASNPLFN